MKNKKYIVNYNEYQDNLNISVGGIVIKDNKILLREPRNHFGGYVWTFPKGRPNQGETLEEAALREVIEETGIIAKINKLIDKKFIGDTTINFYYLMDFVEDIGEFDWETQSIKWVTLEEAEKLVSLNISIQGKKRDLNIIEELKYILNF